MERHEAKVSSRLVRIACQLYLTKCSGLVSLRAIQFFGPYADTKLYQEYRLRIASGDTETKKGKAAVINSNYQLALKYLANTNSPDRRWMVTVHSVGLLPWSSIIQLGLMENLKMLWLSAEFADLKSKQQLKEYLREGICFPSLQCLILDCDILSMDMVLLFAALPTVQLLCLAREEDEPCFEQSRGVGESRASLSRIMLQDWRPCRGKRFDNYVWTDRKAVIEKLGRKLCNGHDKRPEILLSVGPPMRKTSWKWDHKKQDIFYQVYEKRELVV